MIWMQYASQRERRMRAGGRRREGQIWSAGPTAATRWAVPSGPDRTPVLIHRDRNTSTGWYALDDDPDA